MPFEGEYLDDIELMKSMGLPTSFGSKVRLYIMILYSQLLKTQTDHYSVYYNPEKFKYMSNCLIFSICVIAFYLNLILARFF